MILRLNSRMNDWKIEEELSPQDGVESEKRGEDTWLSWLLVLRK